MHTSSHLKKHFLLGRALHQTKSGTKNSQDLLKVFSYLLSGCYIKSEVVRLISEKVNGIKIIHSHFQSKKCERIIIGTNQKISKQKVTNS